MKTNSSEYRIAKMAEVLKVSRGGYYAWLKRPASNREKENKRLLSKIIKIHQESNRVFGNIKITKQVNKEVENPVNHKRVERLMRENGIRSKVTKKYKATTNSRHSLPVAENILDRDFEAKEAGRKMVSDITYIQTGEGWLYLAGIMDLYGKRIIGISMDSRMTKELVCNALLDAIGRGKNKKGCIMHSDRGSQYCSNAYQEMLQSHGFISSMSRKGNCWDNAPMESFWGKMKQEWLNEQHFKTRAEAKAAVFEYIWIFYNRKRIHEANGYLTPDEYYNRVA